MKVFVSLFTVAVLCSCSEDNVVEPKSEDCKIEKFSVEGVDWTISGMNIFHIYPRTTNRTPFKPTITLSKGATVSPDPDTERNFFAASGVKYLVTAEDGTTKNEYTAKAILASSDSCDVVKFVVDGIVWDIDMATNSITHLYPKNTEAMTLTPSITLSPGASVDPASSVEQDNLFTIAGVKYTVTAEDGVTAKTYTARAKIRNKSIIESFSVNGQDWQFDGTTIFHTYPPSITTLNYAPKIALSPGAKINPSADETQNFFTPGGVKYTVISEDGDIQTIYTAKAMTASIDGGIEGNLSWILSDEGRSYSLTISGNGTMRDYGENNAAPQPQWVKHQDKITAINIDEGVTSIGNNAFRGAQDSDYSKLTSVTMSNSVKTIGGGAFYECVSLNNLVIGDSVEVIGGVAFEHCHGLTSVVIPNSVTTIEQGAFSDCQNMTSLTIGSSVEIIGDYSFIYCSSLTAVTNLNPTPQEINALVFNSVDLSKITLKVPSGSEEAYRSAPVWSGFKSITGMTMND
jgi:hypothetical protein